MHQSNYVVAGCGYDWTAELGGWDTFIAEGWVQTLIAFFILVMSARVLGKFTQLYAHQLVGYMLLGFVCTASYMLSMMRHEFTLEFLAIRSRSRAGRARESGRPVEVGT